MFVFLLFLVFASIIFGGGGTTIQFCLGHPFGQQQPWAWPPPLNLRGPTAKSVQWAHNSHQWHWVQSWFQAHPQFITLVLPPYSHFPYCNQTEAFFSTWRWRFSIGPHKQVPFLQAMDDACNVITGGDPDVRMSGLDLPCQNFFPRCLTNENIHYDVDENLMYKSTRPGWW